MSSLNHPPNIDSLDSFLRQQSQFYFFRLADAKISETEMKVELSKAVITQILSTEQITKEGLLQAEEALSRNLIFLQTVYPQPKPSLINRIIFEKIKNINELDRIESDLLANLGMSFDDCCRNEEIGSEKGGNRERILKRIEGFINEVIKSSQETLPSFTSLLMNQLPRNLPSYLRDQYQGVIKQSWKFEIEADITETPLYQNQLIYEKLKFKSVAAYQAVFSWVKSLSQIFEDPQVYLRMRNFLKLEIGKSKSHINSTSFKTYKTWSKIDGNLGKAPGRASTMRIFKSPQHVKRASHDEQLVEVCSEKSSDQEGESLFASFINKIKKMCNSQSDSSGFDTIDSVYLNGESDKISSLSSSAVVGKASLSSERYENYEFKEGGFYIGNFVQVLEDLEAQGQLSALSEEQQKKLVENYLQTLRTVLKNNKNHLYTPQEKLIYTLSQNAHFLMEELLLERLIKIIEGLVALKNNHSQGKPIVLRDVDLLTFEVPDLLSARISASEDLIMGVYEVLQEMAKKREVRICKVDNQLMGADKFVLIVVKIKSNPVLCSIKLTLDSSPSENSSSHLPEIRQRASSSMNTFFKEIVNNSFSPLSYLTSIIHCHDPRTDYLSKIKVFPLTQGFREVQENPNCFCGKKLCNNKNESLLFEQQLGEMVSQEGRYNPEIYRMLIPSTFVCGICEEVVKKGETLMPIISCGQCGYKICINCSFRINPEISKKIFVSLINSVVKITDMDNFSTLELKNSINYNHQYTKQTKILANGQLQSKKQMYYNIVVEGDGFVRFSENSPQYEAGNAKEEFWGKIHKSINLETYSHDYEGVDREQSMNVGILFRPAELLKDNGHPFTFLRFDEQGGFSKFIVKGQAEDALTIPIEVLEIDVRENDIFVPILWLFGESTVMQFMTKVLKTNPFCNRKLNPHIQAKESFRSSKRRISSQYYVK